MNRLHCSTCGRDWYSANPDLSEPCKCGGQLVDKGPTGREELHVPGEPPQPTGEYEDNGLGAAHGCLTACLIMVPIYIVAGVAYWYFCIK